MQSRDQAGEPSPLPRVPPGFELLAETRLADTTGSSDLVDRIRLQLFVANQLGHQDFLVA